MRIRTVESFCYKWRLLLCAVILFSLSSCITLSYQSTKILADITSWKEYPFPKEKEFWWANDSSQFDWKVEKKDQQVMVFNFNYRRHPYFFGVLIGNKISIGKHEHYVLSKENDNTIPVNTGDEDWGDLISRISADRVTEVEDGYFFPIHGSEWTGDSLWFFPKDLSPGYYISDDTVQALHKLNSRIIGFVGSVLRGFAGKGEVIELKRLPSGQWGFNELNALKAAPVASLKLDEFSCLVVTNQSIELFSLYQGLEVIFNELPFFGLSPNSIAESVNKDIYIGMESVVVKLSGFRGDTKPRLSILVPSSDYMDNLLAVVAKHAEWDRKHAETKRKNNLLYYQQLQQGLEFRKLVFTVLIGICLLGGLIVGAVFGIKHWKKVRN